MTPSGRLILPLLLAWTAALASLPAAARERPGPIIPKRFTVMPLRSLPAVDRAVIADEPAAGASATGADLSSALMRALGAQPELEAVPWEQVRARLRHSRTMAEGTRLANDAIALGIDQYRNLLVAQAVTSLRRAARLLHENLVDLRNPELAGRLYLHLALTYLEQKRRDEATEALRSFFFHSPWSTFQPGFYPPRVEEALRANFASFIRLTPAGDVSVDPETLGRLHRHARLDHAVTVVTRADDPAHAYVRIFDLRRGVPSQQSTIALGADGAFDPDALSALVSRFVTCEVFEREAPKDPDAPHKRGFLEADFGYHAYLQHPTRSLFHNVAVGVAAGKGLSRNIGVFFRVLVLSSLQDDNRDLSDRLVSLRTSLGPEFRLAWQRVHLYFAPGVELHLVPSFRVLTSAECKFFGTDHPRCSQSDVKTIDAQALTGFSMALGTRIYLPQDFYLGLHTQTAIYLFPAGRGDNLDFPFTANIALGFHL